MAGPGATQAPKDHETEAAPPPPPATGAATSGGKTATTASIRLGHYADGDYTVRPGHGEAVTFTVTGGITQVTVDDAEHGRRVAADLRGELIEGSD